MFIVAGQKAVPGGKHGMLVSEKCIAKAYSWVSRKCCGARLWDRRECALAAGHAAVGHAAAVLHSALHGARRHNPP